MNTTTLSARVAACLLAPVLLISCEKKDSAKEEPQLVAVELKNHSVTPALVKPLPGFENLGIYSLISSDDVLPASPRFMFGGSADGAGLLKAPNGQGYVLVTNHEDNMSISRVWLDEKFKPVRGEYLLNANGGRWRLCSATMVTPEEHGFGPYFLSAGESSVDAQTHLINPFGDTLSQNTARGIRGLGYWSAENAVPLPKTAYAGQTVVLIGEDASDATGGQLVMYRSTVAGDLDGGQQYLLRRLDQNQRETDMVVGQRYDVEFAAIPNANSLTGTQLQAQVDPLKAIKFGRVEDIDYRKGTGRSREVYFNVTGQDRSGANADGSRTKFGRTYRLVLDAQNPLRGTLEVILDGDNRTAANKAADFQNPDNLCATENYVYIQEDSNGYGQETHDAYVYQYNIATGELKRVLELDHRRNAPDAGTYNVGRTSAYGSWEYGAMFDISELIGEPNTFALCIQPHTWTGTKYRNGGARPNNGNSQASQIVVLRGLPR
ncbi:hypothetical protein D3Y59_03700 [Hymenobacter oligotrophus]|uniref:DUF839 domain-containing protein n=1 Tax=Hymenobacter oligotrophus TaxID=2319843 RepID=A0A3B7RPX7_9BACT|nr:alkaline phosphatase PhoX [Hymenobacter oligotrophus]AYA36247.1 hypothetical protein D3Y59_03700 [Hymenobacter oligotrophus]